MKKYIPLVVASLFYVALIVFYACHLGWISENPSRWAEFGDFMGGVVNPIIGLVTIWLLVVTLKQSEFSHEQQITLNAEIRDYDICIALISYYEKSGHEYLNVAKTQIEHFELAASNALITYGDDQQAIAELYRRKEATYENARIVETKAKKFFDLANELKPMLESAHMSLKKKYIESENK